jgi:ArsR family transcriptional regulator, arsenate/arsenite/antimonite-responsive transcriptional repressor
MPDTSNSIFKALADPTRRAILALLRHEERTAGDLADRFEMSKPTLSHHFAVLREAGLVTSRREGQTIWYSLNTTVLEDILAWTIDLARGAKGEKE